MAGDSILLVGARCMCVVASMPAGCCYSYDVWGGRKWSAFILRVLFVHLRELLEASGMMMPEAEMNGTRARCGQVHASMCACMQGVVRLGQRVEDEIDAASLP